MTRQSELLAAEWALGLIGFTVRIVVHVAGAKSLASKRMYHTCAAKRQ